MQRQAMYLGGMDAPLFAVLHTDTAAASRNCIAVICPPIGFEYTHSHRSVRHLADALARNGVQALRLDYHGIGDSSGSDLDPDRLAHWLQSIRVAVSEARNMSNGAPVCLLGIRFGATLAAMIAAEIEIDWLITWFPVASGRRYVREQQAIAQSTQRDERVPNALIEAAGFILTPQTQASLKVVNLLDASVKVKGGALLIQRDDLEEDNTLRDHLFAQGISVDSILCTGYLEMMAQPVNTKVPQIAIDATVNWLAKHCAKRAQQLVIPTTLKVELSYDFTATDGKQTALTDYVCRFGEGDSLFGIHTKPVACQAQLPTIVMLNSGVVHRVGSNLLYTTLSRNLATLGFPVFRFDLEGIGDSVSRNDDPENLPYPDTALRDVETALEFLKERFGTNQFIVMGLCSGAYYSFLIGLSQKSYEILELVMMNPPNLNWTRETSVSDEFSKAAYYRESMRNRKSWEKLLRGQVNLLNIGRVALRYFTKQVKSQTRSLLERFDLESGSIVANQLLSLFARKRHVMVIVSSGDSGWDFLMNSARLVVNKGMKSGKLTREIIENSDHTFSSYDARLRLIDKMRSHLVRRYLTKP